ncbi:hypothetical protein DSO57_1039815 [Entomophthora muscae]|uniref:Uncharacterized protein n=1 Tax=Entomophthora muscae TaxID=34485 RepID=A0ACC2RJ00_9FUNG|nr:hypothetical protein DSO57_1039815 [Entomophthora muscae]
MAPPTVVSKPVEATPSLSAPKPPSGNLPLVSYSEPPSLIKFWAAQNVGHFRGEGYKAWICSFEDYCIDFGLSDAARLKEVGSFLHDKARLWHQDLTFSSWEDWKQKTCMQFVGHKPDAHHRLNKVKISQYSSMQDFIVAFQDAANAVLSQHVKSTSGTDRAAAIKTFHKLIGIPTF